MSIDKITVHKARVHNLKNLSVEIPRNQFVVITGPSGSGKSSLAFDTIYVEGQRRYIESLSSYARQFLDQFQPPDVESITGLSPSIAIDQKTTSKNPRSTVGTITEIYDYLRVLYARVGIPHCPHCGEVIQGQHAGQIVKNILSYPEKSKVQILAPVVKNKKGEHRELLSKFLSLGLTKARVDNNLINIEESLSLNKNKLHNIDIVIDRVILKEGIRARLTESVEYALKLANGVLVALIDDQEHLFSETNCCPKCNISFPELEPRLFSFNSPLGACKLCNGLGESKAFHRDHMVTDPSLSILDGAIGPLSKKNSFLLHMVKCVAKVEGVDLKMPFNKLPKSFLKIFFDGSDKIYEYSFKSENSVFKFKKEFPGIEKWLEKKYLESSSEKVKVELEEFMKIQVCPECNGNRLNSFSLSVKIGDKSIMELGQLSIDMAFNFFKELSLPADQGKIAEKLLKEIKDRLKFLLDVGLNYLTLNRSAITLSGGEGQRIRLATQIGSALSGVLYVLDEPSIGLHQRDNDKLIKTIVSLRNLGNTVLVVEHDEDTIRNADYVIDMGPGAGIHGGEIVACGDVEEIIKNQKSITGKFLSRNERIEVPTKRRAPNGFLRLKGAKQNNIKGLNVDIPLNGLVCITGVSGSGKSTLIHEILIPSLRAQLSRSHSSLYERNNFQSLVGTEKVQSVIDLDQSPIGRTPHSNPATYTGLFNDIRDLFSRTPEAQVRGYKPGRFSFNVKGGRCEECEGNGSKKIEMHFLPDVYILCIECQGKRYNSETLSIYYKGKNIADVLEMSIEEAHAFFKNHQKIYRTLDTLLSVGLGYMKLGQPATTLSGGEAQRLKLSRELSKRPRGHCLYVLDEPTTGLHFHDIKLLLSALLRLVEQGHTVLVIEHNLDIIKTADYIIDLGPEGGDKGGVIVAQGTPEEVVKIKESYTGQYLKKILKK